MVYGDFWSIRSYILADSFGNFWSSHSDYPNLTDSRHGNLNFPRVIYFGSGRVSVSVRISTSGIAAKLWPSGVLDRRFMEEVDCTRLNIIEHITTGVGSISRTTRSDKPTRMTGCCNIDDVVSMLFYHKCVTYSTWNRHK